MSGFYSYSPWSDAAAFGHGVGQTLTQALIQRPEIQAQADELRQRMAQSQIQSDQSVQEQPLRMDLLRAQIKAANDGSDYKSNYLDLQNRRLQEASYWHDTIANMRDESNGYKNALIESEKQRNDARTAAEIEKTVNGPSHWANWAAKNGAIKTRALELGDDPTSGYQTGLPISTDNATRGALMGTQSPEELNAMLGQTFLEPQTKTNMISHGFKNWFTSNNPPTPGQVTTNSFVQRLPQDVLDSFGVVHSGQVPNASMPIAPGAPQTQGAPKVGDVRKGYRYVGGSPAKQESWVPVVGGTQ